jgi:cytochrome c biogenesis protein CcmG/thiol:disulfide interchange protein DsbE
MLERIKKWRPSKWDFLFLAVALGIIGYRLQPQAWAALGLGAEDTEVSSGGIETLDGEIITLEGLKGRVVLVNAWATWCPPCVLEMPGFQSVYEDYRDQGFTVLGISRDEGSPDVVRAFLKEKGITYPVAMAWQASLKGFGEVGGLPTSYLIGKDGKVKHRVEGLFAEPALRMAVRQLLAEEESGGEAGTRP